MIPAEFDELLTAYVQAEIDFQKFLEMECFKAGMRCKKTRCN